MKMVFYKEIYVSNSDDDISQIVGILASKSIPYSIIKNDNDSLNGTERYTFSISVEENRVSEALELVSMSEGEKELSTEIIKDDSNKKSGDSSQSHSKLIFTYIITVFLVFATIGVIKVSENLYSKYQSNKRLAPYVKAKSSSEQTAIGFDENETIENDSIKVSHDESVAESKVVSETEEIESSQKKELSVDEIERQRELLSKKHFTLEEYYEFRTLTGESHGMRLFDTAEEIPLPENIKVQSVRNMCWDDEYVDQPNELITESNITYDKQNCTISVSQEHYVNYAPFKIVVGIDGKTYEKDYYATEDAENYGCTYSFKLLHHDYTKNEVPYSVRLVSIKTNTCIIERLIDVLPDESVGIYTASIDVKNPFITAFSKLDVGQKYSLYFPKYINGEVLSDDTVFDSVIFSESLYANHGFMNYHVPFAVYKAKRTFERMNVIEFSMSSTVVFHLDLYSSTKDSINYLDCDHCYESSVPLFKKDNSLYIDIPFGTIWTVNSNEGLNVRTRPRGKKIGSVADKTRLIQSYDFSLSYEDIIDDVYGFWIPVKIEEDELEIMKQDIYFYYDCALSESPKITGWVFTGFCQIEDTVLTSEKSTIY